MKRFDGSNRLILIVGSIYVLLYLCFYPRMYSSLDEDGYLSTAYLLKSGTIYYDVAGIPPDSMSVRMGEHVVSKHPPGNALLMVPFLMVGPDWVFLRGLFLHLLGFVLVYGVLHRLQTPHADFWALLYLAFPSFIVQSRTLLSDLPSATCVVGGLYFYLRGRWTAAGVWWGMAFLVRYPNLLVFLPFGIAALGKAVRSQGWRPLWGAAMGFIPFGLAACMYNAFAYGHWTKVPEVSGSTGFSLTFVPGHLWFYLKSLLLIYPFMLLGPFFYRGPAKWEMRASVLLMLGFNSAYYYLQEWGNPLEQ
ncbi:MAG TPA: hypothetical protein EYP19_01880, partial [Desulfobacterales bacterium]|nr:hypothetical protein [Desulfobacterales bacterium]